MASTRTCSVVGCPRQPLGTSFFRVPHPSKSYDIYKEWIKALGNPSYEQMNMMEVYLKKPLVCARHFKPEDFISPHKLKDNVIPSLYLPEPVPFTPMIDVSPNVAGNIDCSDIDIEFKENIPANIVDSPRKRQSPYKRSLENPETVSPKRLLKSIEVKQTTQLECKYQVQGTSGQDVDVCSQETETVETPDIPHYISERNRRSSVTTSSEESLSVPLVPSPKLKKGKRRSPKLLSLVSVTRRKSLSPKAFALYEEARRIRQKAARLNVLNAKYRQRLFNMKKICQSETLKNLTTNMTPFQQRFFRNQLRNVSVKKKGRKYTLADKIDAMILWKSSPKMYRLLNNLFCLPSVSTLRAVLHKVPIGPGICEPVFASLQEQVQNMKEKDKYCTLLFDEMALQPHLDYDVNRDYVVGFEDNGFQKKENVADHVAVFMFRGIFKRWKQPVAFAFCKSSQPAADIALFYKELIKKSNSVGLHVIASVCDQGPTNVACIKLLLDETRASLTKAGKEFREGVIVIDNIEVIPLFDAPHLLKSIRNNLLTKCLKFKMNNKEKTASWSHIIDAYNIDKSNNIRVLKKLTDYHILPEKIKKMKVSLASQVFSETTASAIKYCALSSLKSADGVHQLDISAMDTADLLQFFDQLFDSVNGGFVKNTHGKHLRAKVSGKSPHLRFWLDAIEILESMEFIITKRNDKKLPICLKGWIHTIKGFVLIRKKLLSLGYACFSTRAFNQDPLENFFCQIRQYGVRNTNPTCESFIPYFKGLLIKNFTTEISKFSNCEDDKLDAPLVSLTNLLSETNAANNEQICTSLVQWHPPKASVSEKISDIEIAALGYVSGFIVNQLFKKIRDCNTCAKNILHNDEKPHEYYHVLVSLREYDSDIQKLKYANVNLIKKILLLYQYLQVYVPSILAKDYIRQRIVSAIR